MVRARHPALLVASLIVLVGACTREMAPAPSAPEATRAPVVYGDDDRLDWYQHPSADVRELARSAIVVMVEGDLLHQREDGSWLLLWDETLGPSFQLCADQPFLDQPTAGTCSGTLIDSQLVLTAGHCVETLADCAGYSWVFDYRYTAQGVLADLGPDSVYHCVDIVTNGFRDRGGSYDFAIVQLDRPVVDRTPARVRAEGPVGAHEALSLMGFPSGIPMKIADNGEVIEARAQADDYFVAAVDAFYGNSGSGVFGADGTVAGVLVNGEDDFIDAGSCNKVYVLDQSDGAEELTYAATAVQTLCEKDYPSAALCGGEGASVCGDTWCTGDETNASCPGDCDKLFAVPAAWTCNAAWYAVGDDCDCGCGAYDPDCDKPQLRVLNCSPGSACMPDGSCEIPVPEAWICPVAYYASGDDCDCACGARDPDCDSPRRVVGCARGSACLADGTCEIPIAQGWTCPDRWYAADDDCDCDCGAPDPDCGDAQLDVAGCAPGSACKPDGTCEQSIPASWICRRQYYAAGDECDCNCGAFDPDCLDPHASVLNCGDDQLCGPSGDCRDVSVVEPAPEPLPELTLEAAPETAPEAAPEASPEAPAEAGAETDVTGGSRDSGGCAGGDTSGASLLLACLCLLLVRRGARASASP